MEEFVHCNFIACLISLSTVPLSVPIPTSRREFGVLSKRGEKNCFTLLPTALRMYSQHFSEAWGKSQKIANCHDSFDGSEMANGTREFFRIEAQQLLLEVSIILVILVLVPSQTSETTFCVNRVSSHYFSRGFWLIQLFSAFSRKKFCRFRGNEQHLVFTRFFACSWPQSVSVYERQVN